MRLETERLVLREWQPADRAIYAQYMADPITRRFYPSCLTVAETNDVIDRYVSDLAANGFGFMAVERKSDCALLGDVGLSRIADPVRALLPGTPQIEIGWLLGREHWGKGYAPEAARAWLAYGFGAVNLTEIVAFTAVSNRPSQRVMEKIGMVRDPAADFAHPLIPAGHALSPHVLYRIVSPA